MEQSMYIKGLALLTFLAGGGLFAQTTQPAKPAAGVPSITDTKAYPLQQAMQQLSNTPAQGTSTPPNGGNVPSVSSPVTLDRVGPDGVKVAAASTPLHPVSLSAAEQSALTMSNEQKSVDALPAKGADARVLFLFGQGLPTLVAAPLHVSILELEAGETLTSAPAIGDSIRWEISPGTSGSGELTQPLILIKPHSSGLDTNLVVMTNKRTYYLRLVSKDTDYMARVGFTYKEDEDKRWKAFVSEQEAAKQKREDAQAVPTGAVSIDGLYFGYTIKGTDATIRPVRVMDDGSKTYITMPDAASHQDLPALVIMNPRLKGEKAEEIVNYRVKGDTYIVDRLFDHAALILGAKKTKETVTITRNSPLSKIAEVSDAGQKQ
jgi:type IV secretion system protein TrbG